MKFLLKEKLPCIGGVALERIAPVEPALYVMELGNLAATA